MATRTRRTPTGTTAPTLLLPPPHPEVLANLDAERGVVAALLMTPDRISDALPILPTADHFFFDEPRRLYGAMLSLQQQGVAIDYITMPEECFTLYGEDWEPARTRGIMADYIDDIVTAEGLTFHAQIVRDLADRRESYTLLRRACEEVAHRGTEFRSTVTRAIGKLTQRVITAPARPALRGALHGAIEEIDATASAGQTVTGLPTGIAAFDALTHGFQPGTLVVVAGRPSMGKTQFLLHCVRQAGAYARDEGDAEPEWRPWPVLLDTLEMSARACCKRLLKAEAGVDWWDPRTAATAPRAYLDAAARIDQWPLELEEHIRTVSELEVRVDAFRRKHKDGPILVGIDYLSHLRLDYSTGEGRRDVLIGEQITRPLKVLARDQGAVVMLLAQVGRAGVRTPAARNGAIPPLARPGLHDLKDSGDIEQDADLVVFVHPLGPNGSHRPDGQMEWGLEKHRDGETGWRDVRFDRTLGRYEPIRG